MSWLVSDGGGSKSPDQADQVSVKIRKYLRFCYPDGVEGSFDIADSDIDSCIASIRLIMNFISELQNKWRLGHSGVLSYCSAFFDVLDYRKFCGAFSTSNREVKDVVEVFLTRTKRSVSSKMRLEWNSIYDIDSLEERGCWATIEELQTVLPYHLPRFQAIVELARNKPAKVAPHDLSFATHFVCTLLFLDIKATRPQTYQHMTMAMIKSIDAEKGGMIDMTKFKTCKKYGFDSLIFEPQHLTLLRAYITFIRPHLPPSSSDTLLVTRNGLMLTKFASILGNFVYKATHKYINPTRLRQIVESESGENLSLEDQAWVSEDQKHTSGIAKVHYKKRRSRLVATKAKEALRRLGKSSSIPRHPLPSYSGAIEQRKASLRAAVAIKKEDDEGGPSAASPRRRILFTYEEDECLLNGVQRHGWGNWKRILDDPLYCFQKHRTSRTLHQRATVRCMKKRR